MSESRDLILPKKAQDAIDLLGQGKQYLAKARTVADVMHLRGQAQAAKALAAQFYAREADLCREITIDASAILVLAERRMGEILSSLPMAKSAPRNHRAANDDRSHHATGPVLLKRIGVSKSRSSRAQQIASLPAPTFNRYIHDSVKSGHEPTIAGALRLAKQHRANASVQTYSEHPDRFVTSLQTLIDAGREFRTIVADPPWPFHDKASRGAANNHYPTMPLEQIIAEPVAQLAVKASHLHLWCPSAILPDAFRVIEAWGFEYRSTFVWVKPQLGIGHYWRCSHELLLLAVRGNLPFRDHSQRSWIQADRRRHSEKPDEVRKIIERVSPGPYLEMYGRRTPPSDAWTVHGNQVVPEDSQ